MPTKSCFLALEFFSIYKFYHFFLIEVLKNCFRDNEV